MTPPATGGSQEGERLWVCPDCRVTYEAQPEGARCPQFDCECILEPFVPRSDLTGLREAGYWAELLYQRYIALEVARIREGTLDEFICAEDALDDAVEEYARAALLESDKPRLDEGEQR